MAEKGLLKKIFEYFIGPIRDAVSNDIEEKKLLDEIESGHFGDKNNEDDPEYPNNDRSPYT